MTTATARMTIFITAMVLAVAIEANPTLVNGPRVQHTPSDSCLLDDLNSKLFNCPATRFVEKDDGRLEPKETLPKTLPPANAMAKDTRGNAPTLIPGNKLGMLKTCDLENSPTWIRPHLQSNVPMSLDPISTGRPCPPTRVNVHPITNEQHCDGGFSTVTDPKKTITQLKNKKKQKKTTTAAGQRTDPKEKKMSGERKLNDASEIAKARAPVNCSFKNEMNETMLRVPVPINHRSWDAMPNVCQGFQSKLYNQGKLFFIIN